MNTQSDYEINEATRFGGFWIRVLAYFIDTVILITALSPVLFILSLIALEMELNFLLLDIFILVAIWIYFSVLDSSPWQASVGKKAVGLKVVDKNCDRISFGRATGRHFAKIISFFTILIGYMMIGWTKRKEGLHDMIAGTLVIKIGKIGKPPL